MSRSGRPSQGRTGGGGKVGSKGPPQLTSHPSLSTECLPPTLVRDPPLTVERGEKFSLSRRNCRVSRKSSCVLCKGSESTPTSGKERPHPLYKVDSCSYKVYVRFKQEVFKLCLNRNPKVPILRPAVPSCPGLYSVIVRLVPVLPSSTHVCVLQSKFATLSFL